ncbi:MAG: hypothetical protein H0W44_08325 [Gammaproteobacteria bacterium]|nr:hypothetical protein [Gammaproteobacteria bacterium]
MRTKKTQRNDHGHVTESTKDKLLLLMEKRRKQQRRKDALRYMWTIGGLLTITMPLALQLSTLFLMALFTVLTLDDVVINNE